MTSLLLPVDLCLARWRPIVVLHAKSMMHSISFLDIVNVSVGSFGSILLGHGSRLSSNDVLTRLRLVLADRTFGHVEASSSLYRQVEVLDQFLTICLGEGGIYLLILAIALNLVAKSLVGMLSNVQVLVTPCLARGVLLAVWFNVYLFCGSSDACLSLYAS